MTINRHAQTFAAFKSVEVVDYLAVWLMFTLFCSDCREFWHITMIQSYKPVLALVTSS